TAFKQQRLKAWQPILTPKTVLPAFFIIGLIFVPIGVGLYIASERVQQVIFDYSKCNSDAGESFAAPTDTSLGIYQWKFAKATNMCTVQFDIPKTFPSPVFLYYRLTNFYQNHRRYVKSFDPDQLTGKVRNVTDLVTTCDPIRTPPVQSFNISDGSIVTTVTGAQYYPCGLIANSLFSDFIGGASPLDDNSIIRCIANTSAMPDGMSACGPDGVNLYLFTQVGIAWPADSQKFMKTKWSDTPSLVTENLVPPPEWVKIFPQWKNGFNATNLPDLQKWERFQVWMRTAGMPNFRKLYGKNNGQPLIGGRYEVDIIFNFDVSRFSGTKSIVLSTVSFLGGKNPFLGIAYVVVGILCWILGIVFLVRQMIKPRKLGDHTYLSWNQPSNQRNPGENQNLNSTGPEPAVTRQRNGY
ncbi:hypothetical protein HK096_010012, partial [Nowakowskiella sp. JEL0078]